MSINSESLCFRVMWMCGDIMPLWDNHTLIYVATPPPYSIKLYLILKRSDLVVRNSTISHFLQTDHSAHHLTR